MSRVTKVLIVVAVLGIVVVLYSSGRGSGTGSPTTGGGGSVPWSDYAAGVQSRIDGLRA